MKQRSVTLKTSSDRCVIVTCHPQYPRSYWNLLYYGDMMFLWASRDIQGLGVMKYSGQQATPVVWRRPLGARVELRVSHTQDITLDSFTSYCCLIRRIIYQITKIIEIWEAGNLQKRVVIMILFLFFIMHCLVSKNIFFSE